MKDKRLLTLICSVCLLLILAALPLFTACAEEEIITTPPTSPTTPPAEEEPIVLKFATDQIETHPHSVVDKLWMEKIVEETNGRVQFDVYWGGTLINVQEALAQTAAGVADISSFGLYYVAGLEILKSFPVMFYGCSDTELMAAVGLDVISRYPFLDSEVADVKVMCRNVAAPPQLMTIKPVRTLQDLDGLTIRCGYLEVTEVLKQFGAEGITLPAPDIYENLQKGIIDGAVGTYEMLSGLKLNEVVKYCTDIDVGVGPQPYRIMNWDSYNNLPLDIQKIFDDSIEFWSLEMTKAVNAAVQPAVDEAKAIGIQFFELSPEDFETWNKLLEVEVLKSVKEIDVKGFPMTEVFEEIRRLLEE